MASAIPAAIGVGSSLISGITGKGAAKKQEKLAKQQLAQLQPLINAQIDATNFGLGQARQYLPRAAVLFDEANYNAKNAMGHAYSDRDVAMTDYKKLLEDALNQRDSIYAQANQTIGSGRGLIGKGEGLLDAATPYLRGAGSALRDIGKFYRGFMDGGNAAIDKFLPSAQRTFETFAPEFGNINQAAGAANRKIAEFAPRGGGRITASNDIEMQRQKGLSDTFFQGRQALQDKSLTAAFQGAQGQQGVAQALQALGLGQGQLGLGTIGQGTNLLGAGTNMFGAGNQALATGGGLAQNAFGQGQNALAQVLAAIAAANQSTQGLADIGKLGLGIAGGNAGNIFDMANQQGNRALAARQGTSAGGLGGALVDLFSNQKVQDKVGGALGGIFGGRKNNILEGTDFNYMYGW